MSAIELRGVSKRYRDAIALQPVDLVIREGEFFCLLGPSGCGKTTTLNLIGGFVQVSSGEILIEGKRADRIPPHKRNVNTVFQNYALFPHLSVHDNVGFGLKMARVSKREAGPRIREALKLVGLEEQAERFPAQLSGGQQQRVAVARALVNRPAVLLLDEPLGALDLKLRKRLQVELAQIHREVGTTFVFVTHDQEEAMAMADRIAVMNEGRIEQIGTPEEIYRHPASRFVADFIGESNFLEVERGSDGRVVARDGSLVACSPPPGEWRRATLMIRPEAVQVIAQRYGHPKVFTSWEEMLNEPLDVVLVLTSGSHAPIAIAAARAGMHVLVEKPMCLNLDEGQEMIDAAAAAGVQLMVGTMKRYDPAYERLLEALPQAGELRLVRVTTLESPWRPYLENYALAPPSAPQPDIVAQLQADDEQRLATALPDADEQTRYCYRWMLLDNLVHELNALRGALGEPELVKYAELSPKVVNLSLVFDGVDCHLSWVDVRGIARYRQELAFYGLDGRAMLTLPSPYLRGMPSELAVEGGHPDSSHSWRTVETVSYVEAFKRELLELHAAIRDNRPARTDGDDGLHDVALCRSIAHVHMSGEPIASPSEPVRAEVQT